MISTIQAPIYQNGADINSLTFYILMVCAFGFVAGIYLTSVLGASANVVLFGPISLVITHVTGNTLSLVDTIENWLAGLDALAPLDLSLVAKIHGWLTPYIKCHISLFQLISLWVSHLENINSPYAERADHLHEAFLDACKRLLDYYRGLEVSLGIPRDNSPVGATWWEINDR